MLTICGLRNNTGNLCLLGLQILGDWLVFEKTGELCMGLKSFPGFARGVAGEPVKTTTERVFDNDCVALTLLALDLGVENWLGPM